MIIGIDASRAVKQQKTGTEYYSFELIRNLYKLDKKNQYILFTPTKPDRDDDLSKNPSNYIWRVIPFPRLWSQVRLSIELLFGKYKPDIMFEPAHTIPLLSVGKIVVTCHDLAFIHFPYLYTPFERIYHRFCMWFSVRRASRIITISEYTKNDLIKYYKINPEKIKVIYLGVNKEKFAKKYKLNSSIKIPTSKYIFYAGRLETKKNIVNQIKAFKLIAEKDKSISFVLAGKWGYGRKEIENTIKGLTEDIKKRIYLTGYISDTEYISFLQNASIFSFVTYFEGFGLPILEAMACQTPVICSNISSLPEIAGNAALLVNPKNIDEIAKNYHKILSNAKIRQNLIRQGLNRIKDFSWQKTAEETLKVLYAFEK